MVVWRRPPCPRGRLDQRPPDRSRDRSGRGRRDRYGRSSSVLKRASRPAPRIAPTTSVPRSMIASMLIPCETGRSRDDVAMSTSTPSTPVSIADSRVVEIAANVGQEAETARGLCHRAKIRLRLRRSHRRGEFHVIDAEFVERRCDRELLLDREMGKRELLALAERAVDDAKRSDAHVFRMWWWTKEKSPFEEGALRGI